MQESSTANHLSLKTFILINKISTSLHNVLLYKYVEIENNKIWCGMLQIMPHLHAGYL